MLARCVDTGDRANDKPWCFSGQPVLMQGYSAVHRQLPSRPHHTGTSTLAVSNPMNQREVLALSIGGFQSLLTEEEA